MNKKCLVLTSVIVMLMMANLFAAVSRGERPYVDIYQVPNSAIVSGLIRVKLSENYSHLSLSTRTLDGLLKRSGETLWDALNAQYGVSKVNLLFGSPALATRYVDRHREWGFDRWLELEIDSKANIRDIVMEYRKLGDIVEFAEPEYKKVLYADPNGFVPISREELERWYGNDTYLSQQWHYNNTGQQAGTAGKDISLFDAWTIEKGHEDIIVAVIDGGIQTSHLDLAANIWSGVGYNFVTNSPTITAHDHGTHVAGTIAAVNNNGRGVAGIAGGSSPARGVSLMSCQVFTNTSSGGFHTAPVWAADNGAAISQNSWGYQDVNVYNQAELTAIDYFNTNGGGSVLNGGITIFAAGNDNASGNWYPGCYSGAMAVAATNNKDIRSNYSNYDTWVDISAPGGETNNVNARGVLSTISSNRYAFFQGTSMACPHVSGVAALVLSYAHRNNVSLTNTELRNLLENTTDNHYGLNPTYLGKLGTGRLNAYAALLAVNIGPPSVTITSPLDGSLHGLGTTIDVNATATDSNGTIVSVEFYIDDILKFTDYSAPYSWPWDTASASVGAHTIKAVATDNDANTADHSVSIELETLADEDFETGDFSAFTWVNSSSIPWTIQSDEKYSGTYAAKSGAIAKNRETDLSIELYVSEAGNISFYQKVSSQSGRHYLSFLIDDVQQAEWSGAGTWSYQSYPVSPGSHTFTWRYKKNFWEPDGSDCAWIDHIVFPPFKNPPTIALPDSFSFEEDNSLTADFSPYVDEEALTLSYSGNTNVIVSIDGLSVTFTATPDWHGTETITFTVSDGELSASDEVNVIVTPVNDAPTIALPTSFSFAEDGSLIVDFSLYLNDVDEDELTLSYSGNTNVIISINGLSVTFTATQDWHGTETITFTVNDGELSASEEVDVIVTPVNDAPTIALPDSFNFAEDGSLTVDFSLYVDDVDSDELTLNYNGNTNVTVAIDGLNVTFGAVEDWHGTETITFTVNDGELSTSDQVEVIVTSVNDAPTIALPTSFSFAEDGSLIVDFSLYVNDADEDELTLSYSGNSNVIVSINELSVTFTATPDWHGTETITFTVSDPELSASDQVNVIVTPVNDAPTIALPISFSFEEDESLVVDFSQYVDDVDEDELTLGYSGNMNVTVTIDGLNVTFGAAADWHGTENLSFTVSDGLLTANDNVNVIVTPVIDPAAILVAPLSLAYGEIEIGSTDVKTFTITNNGEATLTGTITTPTGYSVTEAGKAEHNSLSYSIATGVTKTYNLTFAPTEVIAYNGNVIVTSNDPENPTTNISITGMGKVGWLANPAISILYVDAATDYVKVQWNAIPNATYYQVWASQYPYGTFSFLGETTDAYWNDMDLGHAMRFYRVIAANESYLITK